MLTLEMPPAGTHVSIWLGLALCVCIYICLYIHGTLCYSVDRLSENLIVWRSEQKEEGENQVLLFLF